MGPKETTTDDLQCGHLSVFVLRISIQPAFTADTVTSYIPPRTSRRKVDVPGRQVASFHISLEWGLGVLEPTDAARTRRQCQRALLHPRQCRLRGGRHDVQRHPQPLVPLLWRAHPRAEAEPVQRVRARELGAAGRVQRQHPLHDPADDPHHRRGGPVAHQDGGAHPRHRERDGGKLFRVRSLRSLSQKA